MPAYLCVKSWPSLPVRRAPSDRKLPDPTSASGQEGRRARWATIGLLRCGVFAILTQVGQASHGVCADPLSVFVVAALMTGFFSAIMRVMRCIALP